MIISLLLAPEPQLRLVYIAALEDLVNPGGMDVAMWTFPVLPWSNPVLG